MICGLEILVWWQRIVLGLGLNVVWFVTSGLVSGESWAWRIWAGVRRTLNWIGNWWSSWDAHLVWDVCGRIRKFGCKRNEEEGRLSIEEGATKNHDDSGIGLQSTWCGTTGEFYAMSEMRVALDYPKLRRTCGGSTFWTATYLLNKIPCKKKEETPYELWMGRKPSYQYLRVWGCLAKETGSSSRLDDKVVQDKRQRDDNDLQDERQDQTDEEEVDHEDAKGKKRESFWNDFVYFFMVENEPTSYREAVSSSEGKQWSEAIKTFLIGDLEEENIYEPTEGFIAPGQEGQGFVRLVKFDDTSAGYVILCLYVDDMLIVGSNDKIIRSTKDMLKSKFDMKDMGLADVILGIKIIRTQNGLVLSQAHYVDKILNTHNAGDSGPSIRNSN
ncbi:retrotransposon protein, putative, ty1-copia subclass [Tanacetum coccineum]